MSVTFWWMGCLYGHVETGPVINGTAGLKDIKNEHEGEVTYAFRREVHSAKPICLTSPTFGFSCYILKGDTWESTVEVRGVPQARRPSVCLPRLAALPPSSPRPHWPQRALLARPWSTSKPEAWDYSQCWLKVQNVWLKKARTRDTGYSR